MSRFRFALRPKWIISHLFVGSMVLGMVWAGFWQLSRLQERKERNADVVARTDRPVADAGSLVEPGQFESAHPLEFRRVTATGKYRADQEILVRSRSRSGAPGSWVLTPLDMGEGRSVVVNRGWIPNPGSLHSVPEASRAGSGEVTVTGLVRLTETRGAFGPRDPAKGTLTDLARADIARMDQQIPEAMMPFYVQLQSQTPAVDLARDPSPVPAPVLDEGPHQSYAMQWFIFTIMTVACYSLILRKRAREVALEQRIAELDGVAEPDVVAQNQSL